jgi:hypothetical protein
MPIRLRIRKNDADPTESGSTTPGMEQNTLLVLGSSERSPELNTKFDGKEEKIRASKLGRWVANYSDIGG